MNKRAETDIVGDTDKVGGRKIVVLGDKDIDADADIVGDKNIDIVEHTGITGDAAIHIGMVGDTDTAIDTAATSVDIESWIYRY